MKPIKGKIFVGYKGIYKGMISLYEVAFEAVRYISRQLSKFNF